MVMMMMMMMGFEMKVAKRVEEGWIQSEVRYENQPWNEHQAGGDDAEGKRRAYGHIVVDDGLVAAKKEKRKRVSEEGDGSPWLLWGDWWQQEAKKNCSGLPSKK